MYLAFRPYLLRLSTISNYRVYESNLLTNERDDAGEASVRRGLDRQLSSSRVPVSLVGSVALLLRSVHVNANGNTKEANTSTAGNSARNLLIELVDCVAGELNFEAEVPYNDELHDASQTFD
jgi:hypothetical protein